MEHRPCSVDDCDLAVLSRGWCSKHYWHWKRTGDPLGARPKLPNGAYTTCTVEGCEKPHVTQGLCEMHRWRLRYKGDVGRADQEMPHRVKEPKGPCDVEGCDRIRKGARYCHLHQERLRRTGELGPPQPTRVKGSGTIHEGGYRRLWVEGRRVMEHVHVMEEHLGRRLVGLENVHHRNGITSDNRLANLELWVKVQPSGQRLSDLVEFIAEYHRDEMIAALNLGEVHGREPEDRAGEVG
jgi:hypothetical protein